MKVIPIRQPPTRHECPKCQKVILWALLYCAACGGRRNPQYRPELDKARMR